MGALSLRVAPLKARVRSLQTCARSSSRSKSSRFPAPSRRSWRKLLLHARKLRLYQHSRPYDKGVSYTYNISPPDASWSAKERAAYIPGEASLLYTTVHEYGRDTSCSSCMRTAILQRSPAMGRLRLRGGLGPLWRGMMWEEGLGQRCCRAAHWPTHQRAAADVRFLSAIGLHTQGMTLAQSSNCFARVFSTRATLVAGGARPTIRRY